jgi:hypothetical protein
MAELTVFVSDSVLAADAGRAPAPAFGSPALFSVEPQPAALAAARALTE